MVSAQKESCMRQHIAFLAFVYLGSSALAQPSDTVLPDKTSNDTKLSELRAAPAPKQANDIDTLQLASAHRERAASIEEKTNGLWQSWTTSICEGCGNTPSYEKTIRDDFANRKGFAGPNAGSEAAKPRQAAQQKVPPQEYGQRLYTDLSTENIDQIRRMPGR
jgi:hypothetical protein